MKKCLLIAGLVLAAVWILSACGGRQPAEAQGGEEGPCPAPTGQDRLYRDEDLGLCFLYPEGFEVERSEEGRLVISQGPEADPESPKAFIEVEEAGGRTAEQAAAEMLAALQGFEIERIYGLVIDEETSVQVLDHLPGQDLSRLILADHDGRLYRLSFMPSDHARIEPTNRMEQLYARVTNSMRFLP